CLWHSLRKYDRLSVPSLLPAPVCAVRATSPRCPLRPNFKPTSCPHMPCYARPMEYGPEFQEVAHCGGKFIVDVVDKDGKRGVYFGVEGSSPHPAAWFAVYALLQHGIPVATIHLGGIGDKWNRPPYPGCISVFIGSDTHGLFGHECPACRGYWRS